MNDTAWRFSKNSLLCVHCKFDGDDDITNDFSLWIFTWPHPYGWSTNGKQCLSTPLDGFCGSLTRFRFGLHGDPILWLGEGPIILALRDVSNASEGLHTTLDSLDEKWGEC